MRARYALAAALLGACSLPDVTFTRLPADAGADGAEVALRTVTARWFFEHFATGQPLSCPGATNVARVQFQPWDATTQQASGTLAFADVACTAGTAAVMVPSGVLRMSVVIRSSTGQVLASSNIEVIDTARGEDLLEVAIFDDAGYISFSWEILDRSSMARISCATAGITPSDAVEMTETSVPNPALVHFDLFSCNDHFGSAGPIAAGHYVPSISAVKNSAGFGEAVSFGDTEVIAGDVVDLGNVKLRVPVP